MEESLPGAGALQPLEKPALGPESSPEGGAVLGAESSADAGVIVEASLPGTSWHAFRGLSTCEVAASFS